MAHPEPVAIKPEVPEAVKTTLAALQESIGELKEFAPNDCEKLKRLWKEVGLKPLTQISTMDEADIAVALYARVLDEQPF